MHCQASLHVLENDPGCVLKNVILCFFGNYKTVFMEKLKVKLLAFPAAGEEVFAKAKEELKHLFPANRVAYVDQDPSILVFLTGGSERKALESVRKFHLYLLLASGSNNAWAAATEVKAWMNENQVTGILADHTKPEISRLIEDFHQVKNGLKRLEGQRFGLIGDVSEWLVNSAVSPFISKTKLAIEQVDIPWSEVDVKGGKNAGEDFTNLFRESDPERLPDAGRVYEALSEVVRQHNLQALTVECFSLVNSCNTTACLALSKLSRDGIPAGCEGDTCSMIGMMLAKEFTGIIPWIANVAQLKENKVVFAHCTVPGNLLTDFKVDSHFETGKGLAIRGSLQSGEITVIRVDHTLGKMFIALGKAEDAPYSEGFCRTQMHAEFSRNNMDYFVNHPLGNHHLVMPGNWVSRFTMAAKMLRMEILGEAEIY